ncbi:MAG TPA: Hsp20/alpha crystallin family protein [Thermoanaerobaculia bacterium]|nr:Hsp20/alpha crystallin family protein [Thermoanaerobaculia bacterium]HUM28681.1 Hsp20/alpha crystallin family protein [Thermoanaerobaculia bacterium]HXK66711.1 Hsp20/alpha crystallin family protein [Thermoanaerobaculia bacterium]
MSQSHRDFLALHHQLERVLQEFIRELQKAEDYPSSYIPAVDVLNLQDKIVVLMDAPGMKAGDLHITFSAGILTIKGEKRWSQTEGRKHHLLERTFGTYSRIIPIRESVNLRECRATLFHGVLVIEFPCIAERRQRLYHIPVEEP